MLLRPKLEAAANMLRLHRDYLAAATLALVAFALLYANAGIPKPFAAWKWLDIINEGGTAAMAGVWFLITLSSRPGGLVTRLLACGLAFIMLGSWADCLDEFYKIDKAATWDNWLEGLTPLGMLVLTAGLYYWREEQFNVNEHLQKRERLFRDHRGFDRVTQLADAAYLRSQIKLEQRKASLVLLDVDGFHRINREHGQREGDRVLQALGHLLLLNLRNEDLLCRYAGDRFAVLLPGLGVEQARAVASHLCEAAALLRHHAAAGVISLSVRYACGEAEGEPEHLLAALGKVLDGAAAPRQMEPA